MQKSIAPLTPGTGDIAAYRVQDPLEFGRNMLELMEAGGKVMAELLDKQKEQKCAAMTGPLGGSGDMSEPIRALAALWQAWTMDPARLSERQGELLAGYI